MIPRCASSAFNFLFSGRSKPKALFFQELWWLEPSGKDRLQVTNPGVGRCCLESVSQIWFFLCRFEKLWFRLLTISTQMTKKRLHRIALLTNFITATNRCNKNKFFNHSVHVRVRACVTVRMRACVCVCCRIKH